MKVTCLCWIAFWSNLMVHSQDINVDSVYSRNIGTDSIQYIYMTALWCAPCLDKMPVLDAYFSTTQKRIRISYLFDRDKFDGKRLVKVFPHIDFSGRLFLMPYSYYPNGAIQINAHQKMLRNFIADMKRLPYRVSGLESFNLSSILAIPSTGIPYVFDLPNMKGMRAASIDSVFRLAGSSAERQ